MNTIRTPWRSSRNYLCTTFAGLVLLQAGALVRGQTPGFPDVKVDGRMPFDTMRDWQYMNNAGWRALNRGDLSRAASAFHAAIEIVRPFEAKERGLMARSNADYAQVLFRQKRYDDAEPLAKWALSVREEKPGNRSEALAQNLLLVAQIHRAQKRLEDVEPTLRRLVSLQENTVGPTHNDLIPTLEELGSLLSDIGKLPESESVYRRVLSIREANSAANLRIAQDLRLRAQALRDVAEANTGVIGGAGFTMNQLAIQADQLEMQSNQARETSAVSVSTANTTHRFAQVLRREGKQSEADAMDERARLLRDKIETEAARARNER